MPINPAISNILSRTSSGQKVLKVIKKAESSKKSSSSGFTSGPMAPATTYAKTGSYSKSSSKKSSPPPTPNAVPVPPPVPTVQKTNTFQPPPPTNSVFDITGSKPNQSVPQSTINKILPVVNDPKNIQKAKENESRNTLPFYTLITSSVSATPEVIEKSWEKSKGAVDFAKNELAIKPFILSTAAAGTVFAAPVVAAALPSTIGGSTIAATGVKTAAGIGASIMAPEVARSVHSTSKHITSPEDAKHMQSKDFRNAIAYAKDQNDLEVEKSGNVMMGFANWIPGVSQIVSDKNIKKYVSKYYRDHGYSNKHATHMGNLASESNFAEAIGDVVGSVGIETGGEFIGQKLSKYTFKKTGRTATSILSSLWIAGNVEGAAEYTKDRVARQKDLKLYEQSNFFGLPVPGGLVGSALFGGMFATTLGGGIAATSMKKSTKKVSKGMLGFAYLMDPLEPVGDFLGGRIIKRGAKRIPVKTFIPNANAQSTINMVKSNVQGATNQWVMKGKGKGSTNSMINWINQQRGNAWNSIQNVINNSPNTPANIPSNVPSNVPTTIPVTVPNTTPTTKPKPTTVPSTKPTPSTAPAPIVVPLPKPTPSTTTPTDVPTETPVTVPTAFPTVVHSTIPRSLPPLMPFGGGGMGSAGRGSTTTGDGRKYYDERMAAYRSLMKVM